MIKKLFLCAALVGAVGLTSCVDDVESASVVAVRDGKTAEIQALANLQKANAQAELILANAEQAAQQTQAALDQAEIEYNQAMAAKERAEAAYQNALAAQEAANSAIEQEKAAVALERARVEVERQLQILEDKKLEVEEQKALLAKNLAAYEAEIALQVYNTAVSQKTLEDLIAGKTTLEYARLHELVKEYNTQASALLKLQTDLFEQKKDLAKYEAGLTSSYTTAQKKLNYYIEDNNKQNQIIADAEAYLKTVESTDYAKAVAALPVLESQKAVLYNAYIDAGTASTTAGNAVTSAQNMINKSDYIEAVAKVAGFKYDTTTGVDLTTTNTPDANYNQGSAYDKKNNMVPGFTVKVALNEDPTSDPSVYYKYVVYITESKYAQDGTTIDVPIATIPLLTSDAPIENLTIKELVNKGDGYEYYVKETYPVYNADSYFTVVEGAPAQFQAAIAQNITNLNDSVAKANVLIANANDSIANLKTLKADYDAKNKAYKAEMAKTLKDDATQEEKDALKAAQDAAKTAMEDAEAILVEHMKYRLNWVSSYSDANYNSAVSEYEGDVKNLTEDKNTIINYYLPEAQKYSDKINGYLAALADGAPMAELITNLNAANKEWAQAKVNEKVAEGAYLVKDAEITACEAVRDHNDNASLATEISKKNKAITDAKDKIESNDKEIKQLEWDLDKKKFDDQALVDGINAQIDYLNLQIAAQQELVDAAKALLDAALAEDAPAEN